MTIVLLVGGFIIFFMGIFAILTAEDKLDGARRDALKALGYAMGMFGLVGFASGALLLTSELLT